MYEYQKQIARINKYKRIKRAFLHGILAAALVAMIAAGGYVAGVNHGRIDGAAQLQNCINDGGAGYFIINGAFNCVYE